MKVQRISVIGAGTMGNGIAGQAAICGHDVILNDVDEGRIDAGIANIERTWAKGVSRGKVAPGAVENARNRLARSTSIEEAVADADLVIEAVPENMELKKILFARFEAAAPNHALFGSNTSSLSITEIASAVEKPERVIGMHFFNPVAVMKLLELVRGEFTSDETVATVLALSEALGKEAIVVNDAPGFATSRLGIALGNEAMRMFEEGVASAADIDKAMVLGYRHPIGPLALTDLVGLDVRLAISEHLHREIGTDTFRPPRILRRMVRAGKLGRKSGRGFYDYD
jgi:3-hydroxybutyryl-CoA dehydrogenase